MYIRIRMFQCFKEEFFGSLSWLIGNRKSNTSSNIDGRGKIREHLFFRPRLEMNQEKQELGHDWLVVWNIVWLPFLKMEPWSLTFTVSWGWNPTHQPDEYLKIYGSNLTRQPTERSENQQTGDPGQNISMMSTNDIILCIGWRGWGSTYQLLYSGFGGDSSSQWEIPKYPIVIW